MCLCLNTLSGFIKLHAVAWVTLLKGPADLGHVYFGHVQNNMLKFRIRADEVDFMYVWMYKC